MKTIEIGLMQVRQRIRNAELKYGRRAGSVELLAVSKSRSVDEILQAMHAGQRCFGESYVQEALTKIETLQADSIEWHFIGRIQSNKTRAIAENFDWVHSVDKIKLLRRLNDQRPDLLPPLNFCLQIMVDEEQSKGGMNDQEATEAIRIIRTFPRLRLRGLMTIPAPTKRYQEQFKSFKKLHLLRDQLASPDLPLETLSMGMSADLEAAIAAGSTIVRIGTAIFGARKR